MSAPTTTPQPGPVEAPAAAKPRTTNQPRNVTASMDAPAVPERTWRRWAIPAGAALAVFVGTVIAFCVSGGATAAPSGTPAVEHASAHPGAAESMNLAETALASDRLEDAAALLTQATADALPGDQARLKKLRGELHDRSALRNAAAKAAPVKVVVAPAPEHVATVVIPDLNKAPADELFAAAEAAFDAAEFPSACRAYVAYLRRAGGGAVAAAHISTAHARVALAMAAERRDALGGWKVPEPALTFVDGLK